MLNGTSSSGKTALARALQQRWPRPLLHLGTDTAIGMLPPPLVGRKPSARDGFEFFDDTDEHGPVVRVRCGPVARKLQRSFARAARLLADRGHDLVLDLVLFEKAALLDYVHCLHGHPTYLIGVVCELAVLEARERARGDRFRNLARTQRGPVHEFRRYYDFEVDTSTTGAGELARAIVAFIEAQPAPGALATLRARLGADAAGPTENGG